MAQTIMTKIKSILVILSMVIALPLSSQAQSPTKFDLKAYLDRHVEKAAEGDPESYLLVLYAIEHFIDAEYMLYNEETLTALSQSAALNDFRVIAALGVVGYINTSTLCFELEKKNIDIKCNITNLTDTKLFSNLARSGIFSTIDNLNYEDGRTDTIDYLLNGSPSNAFAPRESNEYYDFLANLRVLKYGLCLPAARVNELLRQKYAYLLDNCNQERPVTENDVEELAKNSEISAGFANYCLSHKQDWECFRTISQLVIVGTCRKPDINALSEFEYYRSPYFHACLDRISKIDKVE